MKPYAELLEFNQPNPIRKPGFTRIRDAFPGLQQECFDVAGYSRYEDTPMLCDPERIIEFSGRWDYGENNARKLGETSKVTVAGGDGEGIDVQVPIIQKYISMGHESMLEMGDATFFIECSRVVSHELVRHRVASYQQESQRFVKYDTENPDDLFFLPPEIDSADENLWRDENGIYDMDAPVEDYMYGVDPNEAVRSFYESALDLYKELRNAGVPPQIARYVFPNATRTRLVVKTNVREWRHICRLRLDKSAQPEMQELMQQIYDQLVDVFPNAMTGVIDSGRGVR